jgi:hypothetical protein
MNLNDFIVQIFCEVDDFMKKSFPKRTLRKRGPLPQLADSEVLTMEIVGELLGQQTDKAIFQFFKRFYRHYFPKLTCRVSFARQAANLCSVKQRLFAYLAKRFKDTIEVIDSFPVAVCRFARAKRCKLFKGLAAYGKELGNQTFYGFRLHVKINSIGMIQTFDLAPANVHDIHMLRELTETDSGLLLGDRAYLSEALRQELLEKQALELSVPTKYGKASQLDSLQLRVRKRIRRLIETVGSQLTHYFAIKRVWARDLWHLTSRVCRKVLAHTFSVILCLNNDLRPLSFCKLVTC